jgi:hypothetical protein
VAPANAPAPSDPIAYVELDDLTEIAKSFGLTCRVVMYPSLAELDPREVLAALCLLLGKTREDRAFDMFRDVLIAGERPRIRFHYHVEETLQFAHRLRAGIGGISNGGHLLAMHIDGKTRRNQLVLFLLQLTPDFVATLREPTLIIAAPEDTIGIVTMNEAISTVKLRSGTR